MLSRVASVVIFFVAISWQGTCQVDTTALKSLYEREAIYFSNNKYIKNEAKYPVWKIEDEFKINTEGFQQFQLYKSDLRKSKFYSYANILLIVSGLIIGTNGNSDIGIGLIYSSLVPTSIAFHLAIRADKKLKKAVWIRNRDILLQP